jgi:alpha-tubulin suppressor-like RCC1 family protein
MPARPSGEEPRRNVRGRPARSPSGRACGRRNPVSPGAEIPRPGAFFSLALRSNGTVWAWGANQNGQLGRKTVTDHEVTPARVAVLNHVTKIAAGNDFALALRSDGIVFAWGHGQSGQLGNGGTADSPVPVKIAGLSRVTGIAAGWDASLATENNGISAITRRSSGSGCAEEPLWHRPETCRSCSRLTLLKPAPAMRPSSRAAAIAASWPSERASTRPFLERQAHT